MNRTQVAKELVKIAAGTTKLIYIGLETNHHNPDGVAYYAYFTGKCDMEQVKKAVEDENYDNGAMGPLGIGEFEDKPELVPTALSKYAKLKRYLVATAV